MSKMEWANFMYVRWKNMLTIEDIVDYAVVIRNLLSDIAENKKYESFDETDMETVVKKLGGEILFSDNPSYNGSRAGLTKTKNSFKIFIRKEEPLKNKRFLFAHELGHLILHWKFLIDNASFNEIAIGTTAYKNPEEDFSQYDNKEREATLFADEILLPRKLFKHLFDGYMATSENFQEVIDRLAKRFDVSQIMVLNRMTDLGL